MPDSTHATTMTDEGQLLTVPQAAQRAGVTVVSVRDWIRSGRLDAIQTPRGVLVTTGALDAAIAQRAERERQRAEHRQRLTIWRALILDPGRNVPAKTHCIHGHELTTDNVYVRMDGSLRCLICDRAWDRARRERVRAARTSELVRAET